MDYCSRHEIMASCISGFCACSQVGINCFFPLVVCWDSGNLWVSLRLVFFLFFFFFLCLPSAVSPVSYSSPFSIKGCGSLWCVSVFWAASASSSQCPAPDSGYPSRGPLTQALAKPQTPYPGPNYPRTHAPTLVQQYHPDESQQLQAQV